MREFNKLTVSTSLDEIGLQKSLKRFPNESMYDYKRRIDYAAKNPPKHNFDSFSTYANLSLGQMEKRILKIKRTGQTYPRVKIDCTFLYLYEDSLEGEQKLVGKWNLIEDFKYIKDLIEELTKFDFLEVSKCLEEEVDYLEASNLKIQDNLKFISRYTLSQQPVNNLNFKNIKSIDLGKELGFRNRVETGDLIKEFGDYYYEPKEGLIISFNPPTQTISFHYYEDEYYLLWQPIKVWMLNDESSEARIKDTLKMESGIERKVLNEEGCEIINEALKLDPMYWGE